MDRWWFNPGLVMEEAGLTPDTWQREVLGEFTSDVLLNIARQCGKTHTVSAMAIRTAVLEPPALVLIASKSLRQAGELFRAKLLPTYRELRYPVPVVRETALQMELANGSRIISLPGHEGTIRSFSAVRLLILDEAARTLDVLFSSVRPMLSISRGQMAALSTPWGRRGWWYRLQVREDGSEIRNGDLDDDGWRRWRVTAAECPRHTKIFLDRERRIHGDAWYKQEYECSHEDTVDAAFAESQIRAAVSEGLEALEI